MANSYLDTPHPAEYAWDGERWHLIRDRGDYRDLFSGERM